MQERNAAWILEYGLRERHYHWSLADAELVFPSESDQVVADLCVIGSASLSEGTFCWAWANETIPAHARRGLEGVREFGHDNGLNLLTNPEWLGGRPEGVEMAAVAGRILDAAGIWVAPGDDFTLFFALFNFRRRPSRPAQR
jgi:hypothetical protein